MSLPWQSDGLVQTRVISSDLNPIWEESFLLEVPSQSAILEITCYDHDLIGRHDLLGTALLLMPPQAVTPSGLRRWGEAATAFASGWMQLRGARRRAGWDAGFALSDHADWPGLHAAIAATGARRVIVTHGSVDVMVRYLSEQGLQAESFETEYGPTHESQEAPEAQAIAPGADQDRAPSA